MYSHFSKGEPDDDSSQLYPSLRYPLSLLCVRELSRKVPVNYILLFTFTICKAYVVSSFTIVCDPQVVLMSAVMTTMITSALMSFAYKTRTDFTVYNSIMYIGIVILVLFGVYTFLTHIKMMNIIYSCLGVMLYSLYLVVDVQMMMGDKSYALEIDDYIFGALMLYIDIVNLFLRLLMPEKEKSDS
jgi:FtsH-binding integral membrane protein